MNEDPVARILIVDDDVRNIRVLEGILAPLRYELESVEDGEAALAAYAHALPDLVLLDVMMPGLSGFDVCRQMKEIESFVPVVLVTSLDDRASMVTGLEAGADDFITKPVDVVELRARVQSLLKSKSAHDDFRQSYVQLKQAEAARESLTHMIVHDLRNPLSAIHGYTQLLSLMDLSVADKRAPDHVRRTAITCDIMLDMVDAILDVAKIEAGEMVLTRGSVSVSEVVERMEIGLGGYIEQRNLRVVREFEPDLEVIADGEILRRILVNIVGNAVAYSPKEGTVTIQAAVERGNLTVCVIDEGPGVPADQREMIFEKFGQADGQTAARSSGIGLAFCKLAVEAHDGQIGVDDGENGGSRFWFTIPQ